MAFPMWRIKSSSRSSKECSKINENYISGCLFLN
jgi:hypothetical protein